jgi:hypothetical protein
MPADNRISAPATIELPGIAGSLIGVRWPPLLEGQAAQRAWALGVWEDEGGALAQLFVPGNATQRVVDGHGVLSQAPNLRWPRALRSIQHRSPLPPKLNRTRETELLSWA